MKTIGLMLTKMVFARFLAILLGMTLFVLMLDALSNMDSILAYNNDDYTALLRYAGLRFPQVVSTFWNMSLLLAVLLTLVELAWRDEMVALWAAGISPFQIMLMLLPLGVVLGIGQFAINDRAVPATAKVLREWGVGDYANKRLQMGERDPIWMRAGNDIMRAEKANAKATRLEGVTIFRRDRDGLLIEQIIARSARQENGRWLLRDVLIYSRDNVAPGRVAAMVYSGNLRFAAAGARSGDPEEMSLADLRYFVVNQGFGIRPAFVYEAWWHKRISLVLAAWLMMAVCVPLAARYRRGGAVGYMFGAGVSIGFAYFIFDGISMTIGEMGLAPPWAAAWIPVAALALLTAALAMRAETVS